MKTGLNFCSLIFSQRLKEDPTDVGAMILKGETEPLFREWRSLSHTLHRRVRIRTLHEGFDGEAIDIDERGALLVHRDDGDVERVIAGDCYLL